MIPVPGARVTCAYGTTGTAWAGGKHRGTDFGGVPTGSKVVSMWGGTVTSANWGPAYGIHVVIDHDRLPDGSPGYWAVYAHLSQKNVKAGQRVKAGQQIGLLGATGNVTGPHTHVEIQTGPTWRPASAGAVTRNPKPWINALCPVDDRASGGQSEAVTQGDNMADGFLSLKETSKRTVKTNTEVKIDIAGKSRFTAEIPKGRHTLAMYANVDIPASGGSARQAIGRGGIRTWYQQVNPDGTKDITGLNGPFAIPVYGNKHLLVAHTWPHTVSDKPWEFCFEVSAFDGAGKPVSVDLVLQTREIKIISDKVA